VECGKGVSDIPAKKLAKRPVSKAEKEAKSGPGLLDQIMGIFKKKPAEPPARRRREQGEYLPPP
jgi:hypothetical protein